MVCFLIWGSYLQCSWIWKQNNPYQRNDILFLLKLAVTSCVAPTVWWLLVMAITQWTRRWVLSLWCSGQLGRVLQREERRSGLLPSSQRTSTGWLRLDAWCSHPLASWMQEAQKRGGKEAHSLRLKPWMWGGGSQRGAHRWPRTKKIISQLWTMISIHLLTFKTFCNEFNNIAFHAWPEEEFLGISIHFLNPGMCTIHRYVGFLKDGVSKIPIIKNIHPFMKSQDSIIF